MVGRAGGVHNYHLSLCDPIPRHVHRTCLVRPPVLPSSSLLPGACAVRQMRELEGGWAEMDGEDRGEAQQTSEFARLSLFLPPSLPSCVLVFPQPLLMLLLLIRP